MIFIRIYETSLDSGSGMEIIEKLKNTIPVAVSEFADCDCDNIRVLFPRDNNARTCGHSSEFHVIVDPVAMASQRDRNELAELIVMTMKKDLPRRLIQCFIRRFDPNNDFFSSDERE